MTIPWFQRKIGAPVDTCQPGEDEAMIRLCGIHKSYKTGVGDFQVLKGLDLEFKAGEFVGIIGKSGSGKSTLVNMITGIDRPTTGEVWVGGTPVHRLSEGQMAVWRGKNLGIVFQFFQLLPMLSLVDNIMLPMDFCSTLTLRQKRERAMQLLEMVELTDHAHKLPSAVSGGQQQRAAIARALANDPPVILADEPTGNLDSKTAAAVFAMFQKLVAEGKTIIMVTHDSSLAQRVNRTVLIADGEIVNEYVARALPTLTDDQMIYATRELSQQTFPPGAPIIREGTSCDDFYIITRGKVAVSLRRPDAADVVVAHMREGQYFGEIQLLHGGLSRATVRATENSPVDLAVLDREAFTRLMEGSVSTREAVVQMAKTRLAENIAARGGRS